MNTITIEQYRVFLHSLNYVSSTINGYTRVLAVLEEPPISNVPGALLNYVDNAIKEQKETLSKSNFKVLKASLGAFFYMETGQFINEYRKLCVPKDVYDTFLEQYSDYCREFLHLSPVVIKASIREIKLFLKAITNDPNHVDWAGITARDVVTFLKTERSDLSTASLGVTVTAIRRFFRFLQHNDYEINMSILRLPLSVPNWSKNSKLPVTLSKEDQEKINNHVFPDTAIGLRDRAVLLCFTELGLRCSEVANLQLKDILWNTGTIVIRKTKTHAERELPLSDKLGRALEQYVLKARSPKLGEPLFYKSKYRINEPASAENIRGIIRRLFNQNDIRGTWLGTHALRRTVGSQLYNNGNSLKTVADLLGHSSVSATKAYVRIDTEALQTVASDWPRRNGYEQ